MISASGSPHPADSSTIAFAEKLLSLLDTGSFTTSYKYAVLLALVESVLENTQPDGSPPRVLHARDIGRRVFELYWRHARPFSEHGPLRQSAQRDLVVKIAELRRELRLEEHLSVDAARSRHPEAVGRLEDEVITTVVRYPIPLLQRFGTGRGAVDDRFIYELTWDDSITAGRVHGDAFDDRLRLVPGAGTHLAALAGLVRPIVEREWLRHVARRNAEHVDELRLERFLFGAERTSLLAVRGPLLDLQAGRCFYCRRQDGPWDVDHFLPWARWPDDRLDNLVVADARCNNDKRAALATLGHLERWWDRMSPGSASDRELAIVASDLSWPRQSHRTAAGARGLYLHQPAGTMLWSAPGAVEPLDGRRLSTLLRAPAQAAEERRPYEDRPGP